MWVWLVRKVQPVLLAGAEAVEAISSGFIFFGIKGSISVARLVKHANDVMLLKARHLYHVKYISYYLRGNPDHEDRNP